MKNKPNKGFLKELNKTPVKPIENNRFNYPKAVVKPQEVKSYSMNSRAKAMRAVKPDKSTSMVSEQTQALKSHKGMK